MISKSPRRCGAGLHDPWGSHPAVILYAHLLLHVNRAVSTPPKAIWRNSRILVNLSKARSGLQRVVLLENKADVEGGLYGLPEILRGIPLQFPLSTSPKSPGISSC